jgi:hypothetical protein
MLLQPPLLLQAPAAAAGPPSLKPGVVLERLPPACSELQVSSVVAMGSLVYDGLCSREACHLRKQISSPAQAHVHCCQ